MVRAHKIYKYEQQLNDQETNDLKDIWSDRKISTDTKMRLYRSLIQSIALNGCETWTLRARRSDA